MFPYLLKREKKMMELARIQKHFGINLVRESQKQLTDTWD